MPQDKWAQTTISDAASNCLVPYEFVNSYGDDITREEFCILLGNVIRVAGNYATLEDYMKARSQAYLTNNFSDCYDVDESVDILYALGVVNGKTEDLFDPDGIITREEAAALVCRTAELFMYIDTDDAIYYDDARNISQWARYFVAWVSNNYIMNGTDGSFLPQKTYTVQEAITTVNRLYKVITK
ncbi:MAG: S-layer homology domain-containing protein [Oscillospiraceae bacterium]|nr:S-layer homology domain-containing protein [Oscillospiraceae bacterium]